MNEPASKPPSSRSRGSFWFLVLGLVLGLAIGLLISLVVGFSPPENSAEIGQFVAFVLSVRYLLAGALIGLFIGLALTIFRP